MCVSSRAANVDLWPAVVLHSGVCCLEWQGVVSRVCFSGISRANTAALLVTVATPYITWYMRYDAG